MIKETIRRNSIILIFSLLAFSCSSDVIFLDSVSMPEKNWSLTNEPVFRIPIENTSVSTDVSFSIRTGSGYPFRNIYLFVNTLSPDGKSLTDTLQFYLADEKGNWLGKGFGDVHELKLPYRTNVFFPEKGIYQVKVQHGMRAGDLKDVYDLGIRVEKHITEKR